MNYEFVSATKTIKTFIDKKPKKITGTRFGAILNKNPWSTPFRCWCNMTHVYEEPFKESKYTNAGKIIEPKQAEFMRNIYQMNNLKTPTDIFGEDYFNSTHGDFFPENVYFGGMWDFILCDDNNVPNAVLEMKTTKNKKAWTKEPPEYYTLQAALYAYLLKVDTVYLVVSFLEEDNYEYPENFVPTINNTEVFCFSLHEKYFNFEGIYILPAINWYNTYIKGKVSPPYTNKDKDILDILRNNLQNKISLEDLISKELQNGTEDLILFKNPSFNNSIIGYDSTENSIIYDYDKMIMEYQNYYNCSFNEAKDFVDTNPIKMLDYLENPPIIMKKFHTFS